MQICVRFWSYFRDLTGTPSVLVDLPDGSTVGDAVLAVEKSFPALAPARRCTLLAVGVDYARPDQVLQSRDELSLFPPVQGG